MHTTFSFCPSLEIIDRKCCILSGPPCIHNPIPYYTVYYSLIWEEEELQRRSHVHPHVLEESDEVWFPSNGKTHMEDVQQTLDSQLPGGGEGQAYFRPRGSCNTWKIRVGYRNTYMAWITSSTFFYLFHMKLCVGHVSFWWNVSVNIINPIKHESPKSPSLWRHTFICRFADRQICTYWNTDWLDD